MIKKILTLSSIVAFGLIASCKESTEDKVKSAEEAAENAKDDPEAAAEKMADIQKEMAVVLEDVKDSKTAEEAIEKLDPLIQQFAAFMNAMAENEPEVKLSPEMEKKLEGIARKSEARFNEALKKAMPTIMADSSLREKFQEVMAKINSTK